MRWALAALLLVVGCHTIAQLSPEGCPDLWIVGEYDGALLTPIVEGTWAELNAGIRAGDWSVSVTRRGPNMHLVVANMVSDELVTSFDPAGNAHYFRKPMLTGFELRPARHACSWSAPYEGHEIMVAATNGGQE